MRAHVIENGRITNTIEVDALDALPALHLVDASAGGTIGDAWVNGAPVSVPAPPPQAPAVVSRRQARQALLLAGLLGKVQPAIDSIADSVQRGLAQIWWDDSQEFERQHPMVVFMATAMGLDEAALDALFVHAATL